VAARVVFDPATFQMQGAELSRPDPMIASVTLLLGAQQPHSISSDSETSDDWQATGTMPSSSLAKRSPPASPRDVRHHLQMHWNNTSCVRPLHLWLRSVSADGLCRDECSPGSSTAL